MKTSIMHFLPTFFKYFAKSKNTVINSYKLGVFMLDVATTLLQKCCWILQSPQRSLLKTQNHMFYPTLWTLHPSCSLSFRKAVANSHLKMITQELFLLRQNLAFEKKKKNPFTQINDLNFVA